MGHKAIKDYYDIKHTVTVQDGNIVIGSAYISEIIVITPWGKVIKGFERKHANDDLNRYVAQISADASMFETLYNTPDKFGPRLQVWTCKDGRVVRKYCEKYGWPETTTDGELMYENTFFRTSGEARKYLLRSTRIGVKEYWKMWFENVFPTWKTLKKYTGLLVKEIVQWAKARLIRNPKL